jgi:hypothetical protein
VGVFESCDAAGGAYSQLGQSLPATPISTLRLKPGDPDLLVAATYGRGVYTYRFGADDARCPAAKGAPGTPGGPTVCIAGKGFKSAHVAPRGKGLRFTVKRAVNAKYTARVYRQATLRRTGHARLVAPLGKRTGAFTWRPSRKLPDGYYFAEIRVGSGNALDLRRYPVFHRGGRFHALRQYYGRASCKLLALARLSGPAFGGRTRTSLLIQLRTSRSARATITVKRGKKTVRRFKIAHTGKKNVRRKLRARGAHLRRGTYKVTIAVAAGKSRQTATLVTHKL